MPASQSTKSLYAVLGVSPTASETEIKNRYKALALEVHPDKNEGSAESTAAFQELQAAYDTLIDPQRRKNYDEGLGSSQRQSRTNTPQNESDEHEDSARAEQDQERLVTQLYAALDRQRPQYNRLNGAIKEIEQELERLRRPDGSRTEAQRQVAIRVRQSELQRLKGERAAVDGAIEDLEKETNNQNGKLQDLHKKNKVRRAQQEAAEQQRKAEEEEKAREEWRRQTEEARKNWSKGNDDSVDGNKPQPNAKPCDHMDDWYRVKGQRECRGCGSIQKRFAYKCRGCKTIACVECQKKLTGERS